MLDCSVELHLCVYKMGLHAHGAVQLTNGLLEIASPLVVRGKAYAQWLLTALTRYLRLISHDSSLEHSVLIILIFGLSDGHLKGDFLTSTQVVDFIGQFPFIHELSLG